MSYELLTESFCYGNVKLFLKEKKIDYEDETMMKELRASVIANIGLMNLETLWCIINNLQNNIKIDSKNFFEFIRFVFNQIDRYFEQDSYKVSFDNVLTIKSFLLNDINYTIEAYSISEAELDNDLVRYYVTEFKDELEYIDRFNIVTSFNIPGNLPWKPEWSIHYNMNSIKTSNVDIQLDNIVMHPEIVYTPNMTDLLEKILTRLRFLKNEHYGYYLLLEPYIPDFSYYVFTKYPYCDVANHYERLVELTNHSYVPEGIERENFKGLAVILYSIPISLASYILGFPCISMGSLSPKLINKCIKEILEDQDSYFDDMEMKNKKIIDSKMFVSECANAVDEGEYIDLLYNKVKSYNCDDVMIIISNGVYFAFTYPEFENILKTSANSYNREIVPIDMIHHIRTYTSSKKEVILNCADRGLKLELNGTLRDNFEELVKSIKTYKKIDHGVAGVRGDLFNLIDSFLFRRNF